MLNSDQVPNRLEQGNILQKERIIVVGAGVGGLVSALLLANRGFEVTILEKEEASGGKLRAQEVGGAHIDAGPTVFTMRWVFEEIFDACGLRLDDHLQLKKAGKIARHFWTTEDYLDLYADKERSAEAIGEFAGRGEAQAFRRFADEAERMYITLRDTFLTAQRPTPISLAKGSGLGGLSDLVAIRPFDTMWRSLSTNFSDPRLRQLFGRYATYCGSSPFLAPATLNLVAHVESEGVWLVQNGMHQIARTLESAFARSDGTIRHGERVRSINVARGRANGVTLDSGETLPADFIVANADAAAIACGEFGRDAKIAVPRVLRRERSLSAVTWTLLARAQGAPLLRHNVFFSSDYKREFEELIGARKVATDPTVYVCAQDRADMDEDLGENTERLLVLINAPPDGDANSFEEGEVERCKERAFNTMERCGLKLTYTPQECTITTPTDFHYLFPATGGALYGRASHGWRATFQRPAARTRLRGLYLAGGSTHPGPGVPMAALSGRLAADAIVQDLASTSR